MIFSESEIEEIQDTLCGINISSDDKFGIMIMHVHGNLSAHFRGFCDEGIYASQGICSKTNYDTRIIKYFTKTSCKRYFEFLSEHIKNKIIASSL